MANKLKTSEGPTLYTRGAYVIFYLATRLFDLRFHFFVFRRKLLLVDERRSTGINVKLTVQISRLDGVTAAKETFTSSIICREKLGKFMKVLDMRGGSSKPHYFE